MDLMLYLGDLLCDGRYRVLMRLGSGGLSTVWLAQDTISDKTVVVKVGHAGEELCEVATYLKHFGSWSGTTATAPAASTVDGSTPLRDQATLAEFPIVKCLGEFKHVSSFDNIHHCLVLEPMATTANYFVFRFSPPFVTVKKVLRQILIRLDFLHKKGFQHGDLHPGNVLVASQDLRTVAVDVEKVKLEGLYQQGIDVALWDKQLAMRSQDGSIQVRLADLGSAKPLDNPPTKLITPSEYRAPEDLLSTQGSPCLLDQKVDIWSFGLIMCKLFAGGESPLNLCSWLEDGETVEDRLDRHLLQMVDISGEFPPEMDKKWGRRGRYFLQKGQRSDQWSEDGTRVKSGGLEKEFKIDRGTKIEDRIKAATDRKDDEGQGGAALAGASEEDKEAIVRIVKKCLALDRDSRPEAEDLLQDAFFQDVYCPRSIASSRLQQVQVDFSRRAR